MLTKIIMFSSSNLLVAAYFLTYHMQCAVTAWCGKHYRAGVKIGADFGCLRSLFGRRGHRILRPQIHGCTISLLSYGKRSLSEMQIHHKLWKRSRVDVAVIKTAVRHGYAGACNRSALRCTNAIFIYCVCAMERETMRVGKMKHGILIAASRDLSSILRQSCSSHHFMYFSKSSTARSPPCFN